MIEIRLPRGVWHYDPSNPLGKPGGFGAVFVGTGEGHETLAVKQLKIDAVEAAHRELRIADDLNNRSLTYVMPVLDSGQDAESNFYFVVMPRAEKNLQDELSKVQKFTESDAVKILTQIATGLKEVRDIVHRDLKPANVLHHEGNWKIADFGIARFVEESTSLDTLKDCWTYPYASPEQLTFERATNATDIYALGCIAYALLTGNPPFHGPSREDYQEQHLRSQPPSLGNFHPQLKQLISGMLRKTPATRPGIDRVLHILTELSADSSMQNRRKGLAELAYVGATDAERTAKFEAERLIEEKLTIERGKMAKDAFAILEDLINIFYETLQHHASTIVRRPRNGRSDILTAMLGTATIKIEKFDNGQLIEVGAFRESKWDVIVGATIRVQQANPPYYWGANLWYTNLGIHSDFRWWEVPYFRMRSIGTEPHYEDIKNADLAASPIMHSVSMAARPKAVDDENFDEFCDRWAEILAKAYRGELETPRHLPMD